MLFDIDKFNGKLILAYGLFKWRLLSSNVGWKRSLVESMNKSNTMTNEQWNELDVKALFAIQLCLSQKVLWEVIKRRNSCRFMTDIGRPTHDKKSHEQISSQVGVVHSQNSGRYTHFCLDEFNLILVNLKI